MTEKAELSQSTSSQHQHSSGFNMSVTASGGYGPVSVTTAFGYNVADSASTSQQVARQQSSEVTRKAASRTRKEHKVSFKVASASGTEDQAVRKIKNPFDDKATRIDFYQLVRKWQVDLYRYGVRLTYDLTIPEPGIRHPVEDRGGQHAPRGAAGRLQQSNEQVGLDSIRVEAGGDRAKRTTWRRLPSSGPPSKPRRWNRSPFQNPSRGTGRSTKSSSRRYISFEVEVPEGFEVAGVS